eukprot:2192924-Pyramimonas_sp.AAC.1
MHYRLHHNPARSSGKVASERTQHRSNEGGEMFLGRKHLQAHLLPEARAVRAQVSETGHSAFDGFSPIVINFN